MSQSQGIQLGFVTGAFSDDPNHLHLLGVDGREELSRLFEFTLLLQSPKGPLSDADLEALVREPCAIALGPNPGDIVHGLIDRIEHLDSTRFVAQRYIARMVPQVSLLTMAKRSAIYEDLTVPKMVETILTSYGMQAQKHFEILISNSAKSPEREYVVQYLETDWDFISRWLEREGYFYWFRHGKEGATLVIADANDDATQIEAPTTISFRERNNVVTDGESTIWDFNVVQQRVPMRIVVVDYNYRRPSEMLVATHDVDDGGFGNVFHYGEHFKNADDGKEIAKLRAERHMARQRTVSGVSDCARFRVGHTFQLENHHVSAYDTNYLITSLVHRVGYETASERTPFREGGGSDLRPYQTAFTAQPLAVPFRPEQVTPWPRVSGIIHGHVEADTGGDYAQIDESGRYKIKLPFDVGAVKGLASSRWVRMAQSYAGSGYGMHFPLHKGTEVLVAHLDGDPDRPMIVGSVPNPHTPSPVTSKNATQSVIDTASSIRVEFEDLQS